MVSSIVFQILDDNMTQELHQKCLEHQSNDKVHTKKKQKNHFRSVELIHENGNYFSAIPRFDTLKFL